MSCSYNCQKPPLPLMEAPADGQVHAYGEPVLKSSNPCTVKQVHSLKENVKWFSPDRNLLKKSESTKSSCEKKPRKKSAELSHESTNCTTVHSKHRRRRYAKLDMMPTHVDMPWDEDKENLRPGSTIEVRNHKPCKAKEQTSNDRRQVLAAGTSNRARLL